MFMARAKKKSPEHENLERMLTIVDPIGDGGRFYRALLWRLIRLSDVQDVKQAPRYGTVTPELPQPPEDAAKDVAEIFSDLQRGARPAPTPNLDKYDLRRDRLKNGQPVKIPRASWGITTRDDE